ncbi:structural maintenance of chromosomes protein 3-like isoform X2 [Sesamum indicum]|uniref:Structural maintenance of chromosomes protein 3-like isoform X2 n=1 Tax=Sesamum indicum TaxID=4182 RepID=A0A6I9TYQ7_SESIN|nr:structural maintenance of chromosomes protein 3-like isoform X2 [Sesamum indicum]
MYIKQVVLEGFKSYREQVATETLSPKVNCVENDLLICILQLVLMDLANRTFSMQYASLQVIYPNNLPNEERQALLHEGVGHQVLSAFVEIVFDNSDNRIPISFGWKTEVMNLLESAGFSRSNPYYVVQQGKTASLILMKDSERLDLLKEIGGARVYEERQHESLKIMQDTGNKRKQIIQVVQYLDDKLRELDEEKEELY